jgi:hypothetical protein
MTSAQASILLALIPALLAAPAGAQEGTPPPDPPPDPTPPPPDVPADPDFMVPQMIGGTPAFFPPVALVPGLCTGTLISPTSVLTAGHCIRDSIPTFVTFYTAAYPPPLGYIVFIASTRIIGLPVETRAGKNYDKDLGILTLATSVPASVAKPVPVASSQPALNNPVTVVTFGYGFTTFFEPPYNRGRARAWNWSSPPPGFTCPGDSGGPLLWNGAIIGVVGGGNNTVVDSTGACVSTHTGSPDRYANPTGSALSPTPSIDKLTVFANGGEIFIGILTNVPASSLWADLYDSSIAPAPVASVGPDAVSIYKDSAVFQLPPGLAEKYGTTIYLSVRNAATGQRSARVSVSLAAPTPVGPFTIRLFPFSGFASCEDPTYGGFPGMKALSCRDIGDGANHSCTRTGLHGCTAAEGPANFGSPGCEISCIPPETLSGAPPASLSLSGPDRVTFGSCSRYTTSILDADGDITGVTAPTTVAIRGQSLAKGLPVKLYGNSTCSAAATTLPYTPQINGTANFWLKHPESDSVDLTATVATGPAPPMPSSTFSVQVEPPLLRFVGPTSMTSGFCNPFQVEVVDLQNAAYKVTTAIPLQLASASTDPGGFFSNSTCTIAKSTLDLAAGTSLSPTFYFKGVSSADPYVLTTSLRPTTTALVPKELTQASHSAEIVPAVLGFSIVPKLATIGKCTQMQVKRTDPNGAKPFPANTVVTLNGTGNSGGAPQFFATSACTTPISTATIAGAGNVATFYVKDSTSGTGTDTVTATAPEFAAATTEVPFQRPHLVFSPIPSTFKVWVCKGPFYLQSKDATNAAFVVSPAAVTPVAIGIDPSATASGAASAAYSNSTCTTPVTSVNIAAGGSSTPAIYFKMAAAVPTTLSGTTPLFEPAVYPNVTVDEKMFDVNAGPIWNQADAESKCPPLCIANHAVWNGAWTTTIWNVMSVCGCNYVP